MTGKENPKNARPAARARAAGDEPAARRLESRELFGSHDQLIIEHGGREYRLRITSNGKLILTA